MTTKQRILDYLKYRGEVSGMQLENNAREWMTKASTISRRARELSEEGKIERALNGKTVAYKLKSLDWAEGYLDKLIEEEKENQGVLF